MSGGGVRQRQKEIFHMRDGVVVVNSRSIYKGRRGGKRNTFYREISEFCFYNDPAQRKFKAKRQTCFPQSSLLSREDQNLKVGQHKQLMNSLLEVSRFRFHYDSD